MDGFNQNNQQNNFQQQGQPVPQYQYVQPNQYAQPGMGQVVGVARAKAVICMVFGILSTFFGISCGVAISRVVSSRHSWLRYKLNGGGVFMIIMEIAFLAVSVIFGILSRTKKEGGKGMVIAGFVCAGVGAFFFLLGCTGAFGH